MQSAEQKQDMALVFAGVNGYKNLDFIACWFYKGAQFIEASPAKFAFVSTNSICQGEQVALLWQPILRKKLEIDFAYTSFKWANNAKHNAGVAVVVIGLRNSGTKAPQYLFANGNKKLVSNINAYLAQGNNVIVAKRSKPISKLAKMDYGTKTVDGGNLTLTLAEKELLIAKNHRIEPFIKVFTGSDEFINGIQRFCLWIKPSDAHSALQIAEINERVNKVKKMRLSSPKKATKESASTPHLFGEIRYKESDSIIVPSVSSERREYIPIGFLSKNTVTSNLAFAVYDAEPWLLSILTSKMHMAWVKAVCGRLKTDYRYSSSLCYNTFPFPPISDNQKAELEQSAYRILEARERYTEKTLAQLYDPEKMPADLRAAHHENDLAVERCYRSRPFGSDEERLEYLFKLYEQMIAEENAQQSLFVEVKKAKAKSKAK